MIPGYTIDKTERAYITARLTTASDLCGFERDLLRKLQETNCPPCRGTGHEPYVGGDDDENPCRSCSGFGFKPMPNAEDASND